LKLRCFHIAISPSRFFEIGLSHQLFAFHGTRQNELSAFARHALFEETQNEAPGFAFVVRSMTIEFLKPAHMDDVLDIVTTPTEVKGASITLLQDCRRGDDLLVEARVRVAFVSGGKAQRIPKPLRVAMESG
jgi:acyl-CoA thioester hydrolase